MICYVILHYMAEKMTIECVDALNKHIDWTRDHVIIVDNHSTNDSGRNIRDKYRNASWCTVILNEKNEGFARGNNVGYRYARDIGADFVVVMNNDVIIDDMCFSEKLQALFDETGFDVYGPDILSMATGEHQNITRFPLTMEGIEKRTRIFERIAAKTPYEFYCGELKKRYKAFKKRIKRIIEYDSRTNCSEQVKSKAVQAKDYNQPALHGACLVFSKRYIQQEELAFNPNTFLYIEEEILHAECTKKGYRMIYDPVIQVKHYEDVATNFVLKTAYQREHMKAVEILRSLKVLKSVMEQEMPKFKKE